MSASKMQMIAAATAVLAGVDIPDFGPGKSYRNNRTPYVGRAVPRNAACPCGSGQKYKKCCMRQFTVAREEVSDESVGD